MPSWFMELPFNERGAEVFSVFETLFADPDLIITYCCYGTLSPFHSVDAFCRIKTLVESPTT